MRKTAEEAVEGRPQRQCQQCGRKFASRKAAKRHRCPLSKEASGKGGDGKGKGKADAPPKLNKPAPNTTTAPSASLTPSATTALQAAKTSKPKAPPKKKKPKAAPKAPEAPSSAIRAAFSRPPVHTMAGELASDQPYESTADRRSERLNTAKKRQTRRGLMDTLRDK
jgi:hypothetical protein